MHVVFLSQIKYVLLYLSFFLLHLFWDCCILKY